MIFIPYYNKIVIEPFKRDTIISAEENGLVEVGTVISIGESVSFVKPGDILSFNSWGVDKVTAPDGKELYVVEDESSFILGKHVAEE